MLGKTTLGWVIVRVLMVLDRRGVDLDAGGVGVCVEEGMVLGNGGPVGDVGCGGGGRGTEVGERIPEALDGGGGGDCGGGWG